ncbi:NAD(P)-binding protein [Roseiarcus sp.]|uniref:NAD(P)-binding protein n=1 Tax=Roseiarcus sp. TaxID=1969460 RepID=UPI003F9D681D
MATASRQGQAHGDASNDDPLDLLIVGAGFSGMYMLIKARGMGLRALAIDAASSVGGTWYHNRYPGAHFDIQSLEYSYSFDEALQQQWRWTERYASQPELLRYANHVAESRGRPLCPAQRHPSRHAADRGDLGRGERMLAGGGADWRALVGKIPGDGQRAAFNAQHAGL